MVYPRAREVGLVARLIGGPFSRSGRWLALVALVGGFLGQPMSVGRGASVSGLSCFGSSATIVGTDHADILKGTAGRDVIVGRGGNDEGDQEICPPCGNDITLAGPGDDVTLGDGGTDSVYGEDGADDVEGGPGDDLLSGGAGADTLDEQSFDDGGSDVLLAGADDDNLVATDGISDNDTL